MLDNKSELIKASGAIHLQNKMTLLQRRVWNLLLRHSYEELLTKEEHEISVDKLETALEYPSRNRQHLKDSIETMVGNKVKWNLLHKDKEWEWGVAALLAEARIKGKVCTYQYSSTLRRLLHNPKLYARINLKIQNQFRNAHALALWELCVDCLDETTNYGESPWLELQEFRQLMGIQDSEYRQFKDLSKYVIKGPVGEINRITDFSVSVEYQRSGRKVIAMKFRVRRTVRLPELQSDQQPLFPEANMPNIVQELVNAGLPEEDAAEIWAQQWDYILPQKRPNRDGDFSRYVREKIDLLERRIASGKVESITGFLLTAIKQNYSNRAFSDATEQKAEEIEAREAVHRERQLKALEEQKMQLEREREEALHTLCQSLIQEMPGIVGQAIAVVIEAKPHYKKLYEHHQTPLENYRAHHFLALDVDEMLMAQHPKRFQTITNNYQTRLVELDEKIAVFK
jgi:hypothetical protein